MSSEDYEIYKLLRKEQFVDGASRREANALLYPKARLKAAQAGLKLEQHTDVHYSLSSSDGWRLNIYPGNLRLYHNRDYKKPPFLKVPPEWNLLDVIDAAIAASNTTDSFEKEISTKVKDSDQLEKIERRAYILWEEAGKPEGDGKQFWLAAEKELRG